mgnify:CR=1 FL=1
MKAIYYSIANKLDKVVLERTREFSAHLISIPPWALEQLGVNEGDIVRVIDLHTKKWVLAKVYVSVRFNRLGLSQPIREYFELELDPPSNEGVAPYRNQQIKVTPFEYDIALSFAGENRNYVQTVANILRDNYAKVFFDEFEQVKLIGRYLPTYLDETYGSKSEWCVVFYSEFYSTKAYPRLEFKGMISGTLRQQRDYVIPVRLDDTPLPGQWADIGYIDGRHLYPGQVAELLMQKITSGEGLS